METTRQIEEHLRLLAIFHYVVAALATLFSLFPVIHLVIGVAILTGGFPGEGPADGEARWLGGFFVAFAAFWIVMGLTFAGCVLAAGRSLARRKRRTFCLVMAGLECMFVPFGTALGVFSLIVLTKDEARALFEGGAGPQAAG